jgi:hypothetical protein
MMSLSTGGIARGIFVAPHKSKHVLHCIQVSSTQSCAPRGHCASTGKSAGTGPSIEHVRKAKDVMGISPANTIAIGEQGLHRPGRQLTYRNCKSLLANFQMSHLHTIGMTVARSERIRYLPLIPKAHTVVINL